MIDAACYCLLEPHVSATACYCLLEQHVIDAACYCLLEQHVSATACYCLLEQHVIDAACYSLLVLCDSNLIPHTTHTTTPWPNPHHVLPPPTQTHHNATHHYPLA